MLPGSLLRAAQLAMAPRRESIVSVLIAQREPWLLVAPPLMSRAISLSPTPFNRIISHSLGKLNPCRHSIEVLKANPSKRRLSSAQRRQLARSRSRNGLRGGTGSHVLPAAFLYHLLLRSTSTQRAVDCRNPAGRGGLVASTAGIGASQNGWPLEERPGGPEGFRRSMFRSGSLYRHPPTLDQTRMIMEAVKVFRGTEPSATTASVCAAYGLVHAWNKAWASVHGSPGPER